jgi:integrase
MLVSLDKKSSNVFGYGSLRYLRRAFERQRKKLAIKLGNQRIQRITFHTFRHWKATMLYHQTKDVMRVMNFLGHRNINNTLRYIQLEEAIFKDVDDNFICKTAETVEEAKQLVEVGFNYICEINGIQLFRKRK